MISPDLTEPVRQLVERITHGFNNPSVMVGELYLSALVQPDEDAHPDWYDCYSPEDIEAWKAGDWRFIGLSAVVEYRGARLVSNGIWSVECGLNPDREGDYLAELLTEEIDSMCTSLTDVIRLLSTPIEENA